VAIVDWASGACDVLPVQMHKPVTWEVTPGTPTWGGPSTRSTMRPTGASSPVSSSSKGELVRHGTIARAVLGGSDATQAGQRFGLPDAPIAYDARGRPPPRRGRGRGRDDGGAH
jgi:hypothetical protein